MGLYDIYVFMKNLFIRIKCHFLLITHLIKLRWNPPRCVRTNVIPDLSYLSLWRLMTTNEVGFTNKSTMTDPRTNFTHFLCRFSSNPSTKSTRTDYQTLVPCRCVHARSVHPFNFFSVSAFLSTRRGPCRSEAPSTARAAPGDHEPLIGGARWRSMGELRLGRSVTWSFCRWRHRQGTQTFLSIYVHFLSSSVQ